MINLSPLRATIICCPGLTRTPLNTTSQPSSTITSLTKSKSPTLTPPVVTTISLFSKASEIALVMLALSSLMQPSCIGMPSYFLTIASKI